MRADLAVVAKAAGFSSFAYEPDDPQNLPAAVVGGIQSMTRLNRLTTELVLGVTFYCSLASARDAASRLDKVLSIGTGTGFLDLLATTSTFKSWVFQSAGPYTTYQLPGGDFALGCTVTLQLTA